MKWFDSILKKRNKANATSNIKPPDALTEPPIPESEMHFTGQRNTMQMSSIQGHSLNKGF